MYQKLLKKLKFQNASKGIQIQINKNDNHRLTFSKKKNYAKHDLRNVALRLISPL